MNQNPIIKALQEELAKERTKLAEVQAFQKGNAHTLRTEPAWHYSLIDFNAGHEAATARLLGLLEKAVEMAEFYARESPQASYPQLVKEKNMSAYWSAEPDPDASATFKRVYPAREFLTTLADASGEKC